MNSPTELINLMRPHQWLKSSFVLIGLLFVQGWDKPGLLLRVIVAAVAFSFISSAVYIINDFADRKSDRNHIKKKLRPLANGTVTDGAAGILAVCLAVGSLSLGLWVSDKVFIILTIYGLMNVGYSFSIKHVVILDVFFIGSGFLLRILAGTLGVGIQPSQWLLLTSLMLSLFLGFTKRRAEIIALEDGGLSHRKVLEHYSPVLLDKMIGITATCVIMSYGLYTMSPGTIRIHGTESLIFTLPFVMYAVFRYIYLLHQHRKGTEPSRELIRDPHIVLSVVGWFLLTYWLIT